MADIPSRVTPRPEVQSTRNTQRVQVVARPVDMGANIRPVVRSELSGLVDGLKAFNPALEAWHDNLRAEEVLQKKQGAESGLAASQREEDLTQLEPVIPENIPPAAHPEYRKAYRLGIIDRKLVKVKAEALAEYEKQKGQSGFDPEQFLSKIRADSLGLPDDMAAHMGQGLTALETAVRQDFRQYQTKQIQENQEAFVSAAIGNAVIPGNPADMLKSYRDLLPQLRALDKTPKEAAGYLLRRLTALSEAQGGRPDYFQELMTNKDESGLTVWDANPELQSSILAAKDHAKRQLDGAIDSASQASNAKVLKGLEERLLKDPASISFDELLGHLGKFSAFKTDNEVASFWHRVLTAKNTQGVEAQLLERARIGQLYLEDPKDQRKIMGALTGNVVAGLSKAISSGDPASVAAVADALVSAHNMAGSTEPSEPVKRMFQFIGTQLPEEKPTPEFLGAVEVYRAMQSAPHLRRVYFDDDARTVMDAYLAGRGDGGESPQAYRQAYAAVSPEAKKRAEALRQLPEFQEKLSKAGKWVTGSSFWPRMLGGNGRPENGDAVQLSAREAVIDYMKRNPTATHEQAQAYAQEWVERSFVLDQTTNQAIQVPQGGDPRQTQAAISHYTSKLYQDLKLSERDGDWSLSFIPMNLEQGTYRVSTSFNGAPIHLVDEVKLSDLAQQHRRDTYWLPEDGKAIHDLQAAMKAGKPIADLLAGSQAVIAKARSLGVATSFLQSLDQQERENARQVLSSRVKLDPDQVDTVSLFGAPKATTASPRATAESALKSAGRGGHVGMAASLITMGEGLALKPYDDPASGAGKNIGMGYNLAANAKTAAEDLRRAGVPSERVNEVMSGKAALTTDQAERLLMLTIGRYETNARDAVNATQPRLWERLQPAQRAVLIDIAWQTGDVGQFKKAITALAGGDAAGFREQSKVFYTDRSGNRKEDTRRAALREAMLSGGDYWFSVLAKHVSLPSTAAERLSLAP